MANETTLTSANDLVFSSWTDAALLNELRPANVTRPFMRFRGKQQSNVFDFGLQDDPGAGGGYTEGTGLSNTQLATSEAAATAAGVGQMATVTDDLAEIAVLDTYAHFGAVLGRSTAEKFETDAVALIDDFINTTGTSGANFTVNNYQEAQSQLETRDIPLPYVTIIHPQQVFDLRVDLVNQGGAAFGNRMFDGVGVTDVARNFVGSLFGVDIYMTSLVNTANTAADRAGAMFAIDHAIGLYETRPMRTELERDASLPGTEIVVTQRYGVVEVRDGAGESIITDA